MRYLVMMTTVLRAAALCAALCCALSAAQATEFFVAPDGRADGDGSRQRPLDLATALSSSSLAKPGDAVWLLGGTYRGGFASKLRGKEGAPITVRQYPGQRATIDCQPPPGANQSSLFAVEGEWTDYWGFEVTCSDPKRVTQITGSSPSDINRGGISCVGAHIRFINLVVHDTAQGFGFWSGGEGGEIYGCIIYNNGWKGPDRGHGHAIYAQNKEGIKRLVDNIMFNQFSHGVHVYGSSRAFLRGFHLEGNVSFNNGCLAGENERAPNILVGGGSPAERITVISNYTYHNGLSATSVRLGYDAVNEDVIATGNYFVGLTDVKRWHRITLTGNTFVGSGTLTPLEIPEGVSTSDYAWNNNVYYSAGAQPFLIRYPNGTGGALDFDTWRQKTAFDAESRCVAGRPQGVEAFIRPNQYEPGRAHITVYNWQGRDTVEVDLKGVLAQGKQFRIVNAQDYFGQPVVTGTYEGKPVHLPMKGLAVARPIGEAPGQPPVTGPEFNVFVVLPADEGQ